MFGEKVSLGVGKINSADDTNEPCQLLDPQTVKLTDHNLIATTITWSHALRAFYHSTCENMCEFPNKS